MKAFSTSVSIAGGKRTELVRGRDFEYFVDFTGGRDYVYSAFRAYCSMGDPTAEMIKHLISNYFLKELEIPFMRTGELIPVLTRDIGPQTSMRIFTVPNSKGVPVVPLLRYSSDYSERFTSVISSDEIPLWALRDVIVDIISGLTAMHTLRLTHGFIVPSSIYVKRLKGGGLKGLLGDFYSMGWFRTSRSDYYKARWEMPTSPRGEPGIIGQGRMEDLFAIGLLALRVLLREKKGPINTHTARMWSVEVGKLWDDHEELSEKNIKAFSDLMLICGRIFGPKKARGNPKKWIFHFHKSYPTAITLIRYLKPGEYKEDRMNVIDKRIKFHRGDPTDIYNQVIEYVIPFRDIFYPMPIRAYFTNRWSFKGVKPRHTAEFLNKIQWVFVIILHDLFWNESEMAAIPTIDYESINYEFFYETMYPEDIIIHSKSYIRYAYEAF